MLNNNSNETNYKIHLIISQYLDDIQFGEVPIILCIIDSLRDISKHCLFLNSVVIMVNTTTIVDNFCLHIPSGFQSHCFSPTLLIDKIELPDINT